MRRTKDGDRHGAPDKKEEMEVKGQEEGGEGQDDLSHSSLLKFVCVCMCVRACILCTWCVVSSHMCLSYLPCIINLDHPQNLSEGLSCLT